MATVNIRDLRNRGGEVVDRVQRGEHITITRSGKSVAQLIPLTRPALPRETLLSRWRHLPLVDPVSLGADIDDVVDASL
ncbi:MAG: type II toxin-antitoxin system prevent-host-death family antitoxin [Actinobacteria bacterium]|nr:type II toxin-antitoxin system prevent-host-death family antitoxin [Actinomycetota bacterium]